MATETIEARLERLENRVAHLQDHLAIYQILASYGPIVDSRSQNSVAAMWDESGSYDFGERPLVGAQDVGTLVNRPQHIGYVEAGCAHVMSMPLVHIDGDRAVATGYSRIYLHSGDGWKIYRAGANRWEFVRTPEGWKVASRVNRLLNGEPEGPELLSRGIRLQEQSAR